MTYVSVISVFILLFFLINMVYKASDGCEYSKLLFYLNCIAIVNAPEKITALT